MTSPRTARPARLATVGDDVILDDRTSGVVTEVHPAEGDRSGALAARVMVFDLALGVTYRTVLLAEVRPL
jgi:hypothetical protein